MHEALRSYVKSLELGASEPRVDFDLPSEQRMSNQPRGPILSLYCTSIEEPEANPRFATEIRLSARFLATAWVGGDQPEVEESNELLGQLWLALERAPMEPDAEPLVEHALGSTPLELWRALGLPPRPSLWLIVTAAVQKPVRKAEPVQVRVFENLPPGSGFVGPNAEGRATLSGQVVDGAGQPVRGALVTVLGLGRQTRTDQHGNFLFVDVPRDPVPRVEARLGQRSSAGGSQVRDGRFLPLVLHLEP